MKREKELTALVVDDHKESRDVLVTILSLHPKLNSNIKVVEAENGQEAYDQIRNEKPDILYTGVMMPKISGSELLEKLVDDKIKIPTFIVSASVMIATAESKKVITLASQMYTDAQRAYMEEKSKRHLSSFILVEKPYPPQTIVDRTQLVQEMLYKGIR